MSIRFDVTFERLDEVVKNLDGTPEKVTEIIAGRINAYADKAAEDVKRETVASINLKPSYVDDKVKVDLRASTSNLVAEVSAPKRSTLLSRFGAQQKAIANVWTKAKYIEKFGSQFTRVRLPNGKSAPWIERKGDKLRGIQKGQKSHGISIRVAAKGNTKRLSTAFFMPIRAGNIEGGNGLGVFRRPKAGGKPKALYGPSVDQIARRVWEKGADKIADELAEYVTEYLDKQLKV